ncbi:MAG: CoA-transferase [Bauldia litoralis]
MPADRTTRPDDKIVTVRDLAAQIPHGASIAIPSNGTGVAIAATFELIRAGTGDLRLFAIPTSGLQADLLIGAGAVSHIEFSAVSLGEFGMAPRFRDAVETNAIVYRDATCPAMHAGILACAKGIPFIPLRGVIGSDIVAHRPDWRVIQNPMASDADRLLLIPAIRPDIALFHAPLADRLGNVWVGTRRELITMAQASRKTLVTVEEIVDGSLLDDPVRKAGVLHGLYVTAVAPAPHGAWPLSLPGHYAADGDAMRAYAEAAKGAESFREHLAQLLTACDTDSAR